MSSKPNPKTFDDRRCLTCGRPWVHHNPECSRHPWRPEVYPDVEWEDTPGTPVQVDGVEAPSTPAPVQTPDVGSKGALAGSLIEAERNPDMANGSELLDAVLERSIADTRAVAKAERAGERIDGETMGFHMRRDELRRVVS